MSTMVMWDSESCGLSYDDQDKRAVTKIGDSFLLRMNDYEITESRTTCVLFVGPQADFLAQKWQEFVGNNLDDYDVDGDDDLDDDLDDDEEQPNRQTALPPIGKTHLNTETGEAIAKFVLWLQSDTGN